ncbi:predicted protein [Plenodomus lingam JN3]|uniref:Predicted protein n=1 Tax=Leptosphaeria maculans (strain JN3 / isolate v23.1.3 / race Av1-4-5-6-7-8) TaxID=985895 RepID=E4ZX65_LEPMJ|nr:predicted protein [Plenodomus lingam JN3]CBX95275.1 predicted protein [Plenodomus lingam JN3]
MQLSFSTYVRFWRASARWDGAGGQRENTNKAHSSPTASWIEAVPVAGPPRTRLLALGLESSLSTCPPVRARAQSTRTWLRIAVKGTEHGPTGQEDGELMDGLLHPLLSRACPIVGRYV